jgi:hypothetical protein
MLRIELKDDILHWRKDRRTHLVAEARSTSDWQCSLMQRHSHSCIGLVGEQGDEQTYDHQRDGVDGVPGYIRDGQQHKQSCGGRTNSIITITPDALITLLPILASTCTAVACCSKVSGYKEQVQGQWH